MTKLSIVGIDLGKSSFQVHGIDENGGVSVQRKLTRADVLSWFADQERCRVGMEAGATSHYWARQIAVLGHEVRLVHPSYVKPYVKRQKNDRVDAAAICEAVSRPTMRFAATKTMDQQAMQVTHRSRQLLMQQKAKLSNALRAHLAEFGSVFPRRAAGLRRLAEALANTNDAEVPPLVREVLLDLVEQLQGIANAITALDKRLLAWHRARPDSQRLATIPGIGVLTATAIIGAIGHGRQFRSGRDFAAWIGLVPRQHSSGGKDRLGRISKKGNAYLRRLLQYCNSSAWTTLGAGGSSALSGITAATTTSSIDSTSNAISWKWNSLAGASALTLSTSSTTAASNAQTLLNISAQGLNATSTQTTYGEQISNTHSGTASTNIALYASATGATNNYAAVFANGTVQVSNGGYPLYLVGTTTSAINYGVGVRADTSYNLDLDSWGGINVNLDTDNNSADSFTINKAGTNYVTITPSTGTFNFGSASSSTQVQYTISSGGTGASTPSLILLNTSGATPGTFGPNIIFNNSVAGKNPFVLQESQSSTSEFTIADGNSPYTTYFAVTQAGNVGIGTAGPVNYLTVIGDGSGIAQLGTAGCGSNYVGLTLGQTSQASGCNNYNILSSSSDQTLYINRPTGNNINFRENNSTQMTILSGGMVGIGTTGPTAPLDVAGPIRSEADSYVSSDFSKTSSTSLSAITGLTSGTLTAGKAYAFDIWLYTTSNSSGGIKVDLNGGSAAATTLIGDSQEWDGTSIGTRTAFSALNTSLCAITAVSTATCHITGTIIVNTGGTFIPEFAQNASNGTASKVKAGSVMLIRQLN